MAMPEPQIPATANAGAPASFNTVFIDTSLDTHLAMVVSSSDTVADLKKKIMDEHPQCFPKLGEIKIDALKVKRRGSYYHLAGSMLVRSAFDGVNKDWVVIVEASIVPNDKEIELGEANLAVLTMNNGLEEWGVNVVLDGRVDVMPERDLLGSQKESNGLLVEVARAAELAGGDARGDRVVSMVPFVGDGFHREEKCDEEAAQEMEIERATIGKELSNFDASSILSEGAADVKEKRKKRKRSKQGAGDLSGKDVDVSMRELGAKGGEEEIKVPETTALQERSEGVIGDVQISDQHVAGVQTVYTSILPEGATDVKEKRKKRKKSKQGVGDLSGKEVDVSMHELGAKGGEEEIQVPETTALQERSEGIIGDVQISDQNVAGVQTRETIALAQESEAQVKHVEFAIGHIVNEETDKLFEDNLDHLPEANKQSKTGKEIDAEASLRESRSIVSESNEMTCEPPALTQLPIIDEQQLVTATQEGPNADTLEAVDQLANQIPEKKKRRKKSPKKVDKDTAGVARDEANAGEEMHLKEAGINSGNVAEEPPLSDTYALQPSDVSLKKDADRPQEQQNNLLPRDINEVEEPITDEMNKVESEREVPETISTTVQEEPVDSILPEVDPSVDHGKAPKKRKSKKRKEIVSGTVPVLSDANHVRDYSASDIPSSEPEKVGNAENSIHEAVDMGDVQEAVSVDGLRASLLVTDKEIDEVIKNVVESAQQTTNSVAVAENKEGKSRKKTKKNHGADGKNSVLPTQAEDKCTDETVPASSTVSIHGTDSSRLPYDVDLTNPSFKDSLDRAEIGSLAEKVDGDAENAIKANGVNFSSYFIPSEQNKKTADPSEVTGAWTKTKSKQKKKAQEGNLHDISPKLPGSPSLNEKLQAQAKPQEMKAEPLSGKANRGKLHPEEAQESNPQVPPNGGKPKKGIEHHPSESSTILTPHAKSGKKYQAQSQQTGVNGRRGSNANPGEVVNSTVHPKSVVASRSLFKSNPFGDDSDDSLEVYHFPCPLNQSRASSPETNSNVSVSAVHTDGESDAGFDGNSSQKGMKTPFSSGIALDTILKSSKRYKKAKLDAESQPEDFIPSSPTL